MFRYLTAASLAFLVCSTGANAQALSGRAEAVDGDTLSFTGMRVRLLGIDAVEADQTCERDGATWACGAEARARMQELVSGTDVKCVGTENDVYGRLVARCTAGSIDIAEAMVLGGFALADTPYHDTYVETEARARQFSQGIWASAFVRPSEWRAANPAKAPKVERVASTVVAGKPSRAQGASNREHRDKMGRCAIKGNHSKKGEWIYHLPGQAYYNQTRPEARFCTEAAAQRAGYRRSKV